MKIKEQNILLLDIAIQTILFSTIIWYFILMTNHKIFVNFRDLYSLVEASMIFIPLYQFFVSAISHYFLRKNMTPKIKSLRKKSLTRNFYVLSLAMAVSIISLPSQTARLKSFVADFKILLILLIFLLLFLIIFIFLVFTIFL